MSRGERLAFAVVLGLAVLVCGTAGAAAYAWQTSGRIRLAVHESGPDGIDLAVSIPGALLNTAIALCPLPSDLADDPVFGDVLPALRNATDSLATMPDAVLVDVRDGDGHVRIAKTGREIVIRVHAPGERFELAMPIESLRRVVAKLERKVTA